MKKLIKGILDFRRHVLPAYRQTFERLGAGQAPDALFIACSDSRVVPNLFASTNPGDLFVVRNVGNLVPPCLPDGKSVHDESEAAAIEFASEILNVKDVIVCGHSQCGAMKALLSGRESLAYPNLRDWLRHGEEGLARLQEKGASEGGKKWEPFDQLSQLNVLEQLRHLRTYGPIRDREKAGTVRLHGWWFDIKTADVYLHDTETGEFELLDERQAARFLTGEGETDRDPALMEQRR